MCLSLRTSLTTLDIHSSQNDYHFKQEILFHIFMTYMKEKPMNDVAASYRSKI